ncbi:tectonic-like complex member MKS1 isoform X2 [Dermacentor variabilis]|uniref:tectonic-like complex member MKS1 isoform X2 n=1 Tax=Dermacentor variabilis TaxID=34621 RepID=UPI003F5BD99E
MDPVKVLIFGTIATAEDFENDDLFVHFFFHLENGWTSSCPLFGVTQCSRTRPKGRVEVAHFSHPFELELERTAGDGDQEGLAVVGRLFVEVLSLDYWNRLRVEGYAYCDLLESPGQRELSLLTWRPLSRSLVSRMRRFFTGGDPPLEDLCAAGASTAAASSGQNGDAEVQSQGDGDSTTSSGVDWTASKPVKHHCCTGIISPGQEQDAGGTCQTHSPGPGLSNRWRSAALKQATTTAHCIS